MYLFLLCLLVVAPEDALKLGAGQPWYDQNTAKPQSLEAILDYRAGTGRIGVPAGYSPFRIVRKDAESGKIQQFVVHAPGYETLLALNVGQRVQVEGKVVSKGEGAASHEELWIGTMKPLGPAPLNVFTELKPIARSSRFQPGAARVTNDAATIVIRSGKEAAKAIGFDQGVTSDADRQATLHLAQLFGVKSIDWKTQMVIYVGNVYQGTRTRLTKIEITRLDVHEKGVTVFWKSEEGPQQVRTAYSTDTVLVPKVDGEITFKMEEGKKPADTKNEKPVPEKIVPVIPGAPIK